MRRSLTNRSGSCRDTAWLMCQILRHLGLASRFVSGYLIQLKQDVESLDGPSGAAEDFTDLHAWTEVYLPGAGWVGLDGTSGLFAGEGHLPLCCTPNFSSAAPITGALEFCNSTMRHEMKVTRILEDRRVTKPYSESEWAAIDALGNQVDQHLILENIELTMGGEPTFVSLDDRSGVEWNFAALGEKKKELGKEMLFRLKNNFSSGGLLHFTQGKWYPGEILPRWAFNCFWRRDGQPIWNDEKLFADPDDSHQHPRELGEKFLKRLAEKLGIPGSYVLAAQEDTPYYLWKEQRLPKSGDWYNVDTFEKTERLRLQKLLEDNLNVPTGFVLPLHHSPVKKRWISNKWEFRSGHLVLIPGDSPIGLRLPLNQLPDVEASASERIAERSPYDQNAPLPTWAELCERIQTRKTVSDQSFASDPSGLFVSAICAQIHRGTLHLFFPPIPLIEHALELLAAIELVAAELKTPIVIQGYPPPRDLRLNQFSVTPDPGVLEINIQPAADWKELKTITSTVYGEARQARLTTEKFLLDGRRVGTGGGNHIVVGASIPEKSPFLRRPDLLRSMVTFWQHHPALSYLFSSMYIGPTSQAPRIDEARHDALHELEVAFRQIPSQVKHSKNENTRDAISPWLVDRIFRNVLVDLTGNTHRAEFCIDKLYSPDGQSGRLGLLELRGFEMPPHPQMSLVQNLMIRALICTFWQKPYEHRLIHWGTELHDRFMLPHFLWQDMQDITYFLNQHGYAFQTSWFEPFLDFRFPLYGTTSIGEMQLELRMALEPWPVLGEEMSAGGVSRAVDSSVERLQVKVRGLIPSHHIVTCNGYQLPMRQTAEKDVAVAGLRYKAWAPPSCMHPTIGVHTPLVFDIVDARFQKSLGGCTYHVMHPGGRSYETMPVNESEADGRLMSRFQALGHTPGSILIPEAETNPDFPYTLDLRRFPVKKW
ncbi:MAG: transglutaminase family protein [Zavarzinella sp.]